MSIPRNTQCAPSTWQSETLVVHGNKDIHHTGVPSRDLVPPIHPSTTFERAGDGSYPGNHMYSRISSPAYSEIENLLAALEEGEEALLFSSGMSAGSALLQALKQGDRIVVPRSMYWGMRNGIQRFAEDWRLDLGFYENTRLEEIEQKVSEKATRLLWIETPANPTWDITDIEKASEIAHRFGALVVVDSTIASPVLSRPLRWGADIVLHSATKYLNGHSDVVAGALITKGTDEFWDRIRFVRTHAGAILGPFEAWLLLRGMRTLFIRVRAASGSALKIARQLDTHPAISHVLYPGLPSHPGHDVAQKQMQGGFGGMLSIRLAEGEQKARDVAARLQVFKRATSLGSVESLVEHRASIEGEGTVCPVDLLRISVGIEPVEDLLADLAHALNES
ncbi:MAG: aminotransferase class I/II-fold pyridoxal phosphate-dependent enzyme [Burkholderiaceae bacterium]|nr:aminotransferase class I/II-fold pyridoxal phosphate-dependent enzyme [Burkholderiaceae bacterium]